MFSDDEDEERPMSKRSRRSMMVKNEDSYVLPSKRARGLTKSQMRKAVINMAEKKYHDVSETFNASNAILNTGVMRNITLVPQGFDDTQRIGDKATGRSIQFNIEISSTSAATQSNTFALRCIGFIWKDDSSPNITDILEFPSATSNMTSALNHDKKVKRRVLFDEVYWTYADVTGSAFGVYRPYLIERCYKELDKMGKDKIINYEGGTTTGVNNIYILFVTPLSASNTMWVVNYYTRYNYVDV